MKYGALSNDTGRVKLTWRLQPAGGAAQPQACVFCWEEQGGPPCEPPTTRGFGSQLVERSLGGRPAEFDYRKTGLVCTFEVPMPAREPEHDEAGEDVPAPA